MINLNTNKGLISIDSHFPKYLPRAKSGCKGRKKCQQCNKKGLRRDTTICCVDCSGSPGLCLQECFQNFHRELAGQGDCKPLSQVTYRYRCKICGIGYQHMYSFKRHYASKHQKCRYCCYTCCLEFDDLDAYNSHLMGHWDKSNYKCFDCDACSASKNGITSHVQTHLSKTLRNTLQCEICDKYFTRFQINWHMKRHPNIEDSISCDKCNFTGKTRNALNAHMQLVHCHYHCDGCDYIGRTWQELDVHNFEQHKQSRVYAECSECYLIYPTEKLLESHVTLKHPQLSLKDLVRYRTNLKCSVCGEVQKSFRALRYHQLTHSKYPSGLGFIQCKLCLLFYTSKDGCKKHVLVKHPEASNKDTYDSKEELKCPFCDKKLDRVGSMNDHIKAHKQFRGKQKSLDFFECKVCHLVYANQKSFIVHLARVHPGVKWTDIYRERKDLKCSTCDRSLKSIQAFNKHVTRHVLRSKKKAKAPGVASRTTGSNINSKLTPGKPDELLPVS